MTADRSAVVAPRVPTDDEWLWVYGRLSGRVTGEQFRTSTALVALVWSAVHEHGFSVPIVAMYRIELHRYNADTDNWTQIDVWRDRLGRFRNAHRFTLERAGSARSIAAAKGLL